MIKNFFAVSCCCLLLIACSSSKNNTTGSTSTMAIPTTATTPAKGVQIVEKPSEKRIDVFMDGDLFTAYIYPDDIAKPVLYPLRTKSGKTLTRGFPLDPLPGERVDHPHHVGHWLNYGDVNGLDFWNNSTAIPASEKSKYGTIFHKQVAKIENGKESGTLAVTTEWKAPDGTVLLDEATEFVFRQQGNGRIIERTTTLKAKDKKVTFTDNKEGMLGIRVARALELPSNEPAVFTDAQGNPTEVKALNNDGVTGNYVSSEGLEGDAVWGTRGTWMNLYGTMDGEAVSLTIFDHPKNVGYPTYWHARGYGLFAANTLGQKALSGGKDELNFALNPGESVTFRYKILVHSGSRLTAADLEKEYQAFAK